MVGETYGEGQSQQVPEALTATVGSCYRNGWQQMWKYFPVLLLIFIVSIVINIPSIIPIVGTLYGILVGLPLTYGFMFVSLKVARGDDPRVEDLFSAFGNYLNTLAALLLVGLICLVGFAFLIIPGVIFACKLAFVPYLVVDTKKGVIDAIKESWRMTTGYAWKVFFIWLLGIPIIIAGVICLLVGLIPAFMLVHIASASLYHAIYILGKTPA